MGMQMDDRSFQTLLLDSQVLGMKDETKWNFDILQDLIEGPLLNPKRMEEAIKASKYMRKLISFFHPFAHRFSDLSKSKANVRWVRLGCMLMNTLLSSPEGIRFLGEDEFLTQIVKSFAQLDPVCARCAMCIDMPLRLYHGSLMLHRPRTLSSRNDAWKRPSRLVTLRCLVS